MTESCQIRIHELYFYLYSELVDFCYSSLEIQPFLTWLLVKITN